MQVQHEALRLCSAVAGRAYMAALRVHSLAVFS